MHRKADVVKNRKSLLHVVSVGRCLVYFAQNAAGQAGQIKTRKKSNTTQSHMHKRTPKITNTPMPMRWYTQTIHNLQKYKIKTKLRINNVMPTQAEVVKIYAKFSLLHFNIKFVCAFLSLSKTTCLRVGLNYISWRNWKCRPTFEDFHLLMNEYLVDLGQVLEALRHAGNAWGRSTSVLEALEYSRNARKPCQLGTRGLEARRQCLQVAPWTSVAVCCRLLSHCTRRYSRTNSSHNSTVKGCY